MKTGEWFCCGRRKLVVVFVLYKHDDTGEICTAEKSLVSGCLMLACVCLCRCPLVCRFARWPARPLACMYVTVCTYVCHPSHPKAGAAGLGLAGQGRGIAGQENRAKRAGQG